MLTKHKLNSAKSMYSEAWIYNYAVHFFRFTI